MRSTFKAQEDRQIFTRKRTSFCCAEKYLTSHQQPKLPSFLGRRADLLSTMVLLSLWTRQSWLCGSRTHYSKRSVRRTNSFRPCSIRLSARDTRPCSEAPSTSIQRGSRGQAQEEQGRHLSFVAKRGLFNAAGLWAPAPFSTEQKAEILCLTLDSWNRSGTSKQVQGLEMHPRLLLIPFKIFYSHVRNDFGFYSKYFVIMSEIILDSTQNILQPCQK